MYVNMLQYCNNNVTILVRELMIKQEKQVLKRVKLKEL